MPYISTVTSVKISEDKKRTLTKELGEAISLIDGKSERWLMLSFIDECSMAFAGDSVTPCAMIKVEIFGKAEDGEYDALTKRLCDLVARELDIPKDRIYVNYREVSRWGMSGYNF